MHSVNTGFAGYGYEHSSYGGGGGLQQPLDLLGSLLHAQTVVDRLRDPPSAFAASPGYASNPPIIQSEYGFAGGQQNDGTSRMCGKHTCQCDGVDWTLAGDTQHCEPVCSNECAVGDPCRTIEAPLNRCKFTPATRLYECGYHTCLCSQGWLPTFGSQGCQRLLQNACQKAGDPCNNGLHYLNVCVLEEQSDYRCDCRAPGFDSDVNGRACIIIGPFGSAPDPSSQLRAATSASMGSGQRGGQRSGQTGGQQTSDQQACGGHDHCMVYLNPANSCTDLADGAFKCRCGQKGYVANHDFTACVQRRGV